MNKKLLYMFVCVLVFVPIFLCTGCGDDKEPTPQEPTTYKVSLSYANIPDAKYFEVTSNPSGTVQENKAITYALKFKEGYRPDGLVAKLNNQTVTTAVITDTTDNSAYSSSTPISHDVLWSLTVEEVTADTNLFLDFGACKVGEVQMTLDKSLQNAGLKYAVLETPPTSAITRSAELSELLGSEVKTAESTISCPYNSYVIFLTNQNTTALTFSNSSVSSTSSINSKTVTASVDYLNLDYFNYTAGNDSYHVVATTITDDNWKSITATINDTPDSKNQIANTFAIAPLQNGTSVRGLATQSENTKNNAILAQTYVTDDGSEKSFIERSFEYDNETRKYYVLGHSNLIYANIEENNISSVRQNAISKNTYAWVEDDLVMLIDGLGYFNNGEDASLDNAPDHYYLSSSININDSNCTKVDVNDYLVKKNEEGKPVQYYLYIPHAKILEIINNNSAFVTEYKGEKYAFAYLVLEKNTTSSNVLKMTVEGFDFENYDLDPTLSGYNMNGSEVDESSIATGQVTFINYANTGKNGAVAPIYYLYTGETSSKNLCNLCFNVPVMITNGFTTQYYESFTYTITQNNSEEAEPYTVKFADSDYTNGSVMKRVCMDITGVKNDFTLKLQLKVKTFDTSTHSISLAKNSDRDFYFAIANLENLNGLPEQWTNLKGLTLEMEFTQTKVLFLLTELNTTTTETQITTEKLGLLSEHQGDETESDTTEDTLEDTTEDTTPHYDTLYSARVYTDMLGRTATVSVEGKTYVVRYIILPQAYYNTNESFFVGITITTTTITPASN